MRASAVLLIGLLLVNLAVDWYIVRQVKTRVRQHRKFWYALEWVSAILTDLVLLAAIIIPAKEGTNNLLLSKMWLLFSYLTVFFPKVTGVLFDLIASIPTLFAHKRIKTITVTGIVLSILLFAGMWWGALFNRYRIDTKEVTVEITDLPESFDGYRILQLSDLHTGTYNGDTTFVAKVVDASNAAQCDAIFFTGDIVNRETTEIVPFIPVLSRLSAPDGVYAILGNHDYGDYKSWEIPEDKDSNLRDLEEAFRQTGMDLLQNETRWLCRGNDSVAVIGVGNIGDPPFKIYGSLKQAYPETGDNKTKILLTHNPAHWNDSIRGRDDVKIPLTLSGHTHAMQIELFGISPAALRYETWGGLYADEHEHHQLYVNIGEGTVGMPMRLGATPEITVITLRRRK